MKHALLSRSQSELKEEFIHIPKGSLRLRDGYQDGANYVAILPNDIFVCRYPVTTREYFLYAKECNIETEYEIEVWDGEWKIGGTFEQFNPVDGNYPVVGVSYSDCLNFIEWAVDKFSLPFRLLTEAEFEYSARLNCSCEDICQASVDAEHYRANNNVRAGSGISGRPDLLNSVLSPSGLNAMIGCVWQWCSDWYSDYPSGTIINPTGPIEQPKFSNFRMEILPPGKVIRGGSFSYPRQFNTCRNRHMSFETDRNFNLGFRICF